MQGSRLSRADLQQGRVVEGRGRQLLCALCLLQLRLFMRAIQSSRLVRGRPDAVSVGRQLLQWEGPRSNGGNQADGEVQRRVMALQLRLNHQHRLSADNRDANRLRREYSGGFIPCLHCLREVCTYKGPPRAKPMSRKYGGDPHGGRWSFILVARSQVSGT